MASEQYWIGKDLDLESLWSEYDSGQGYINKFKSIEPYLLRLTFDKHPIHFPLFDAEVIYKTVKGTFHDVKAECLSPQEYNEAAPIFLYQINRGSGIFEFLGQFDPLLTYVSALGAAMMYYRSSLAKDQDYDEKKLNFIRSQFPDASNADVSAYMKAWTTWGRREVMHRLIGNGLCKIEISKESITSETDPKNVGKINVTEIFEHESNEKNA